MGIYDVPASELIEAMAADLAKEIEKPTFTEYVKTGANRERAPLRNDWWYVRIASVLYRIYKDGAVGTESLRTYYGGKKNRGSKPEKFKKAGGKIVRTALQELEKAGYLAKTPKGRKITGKGQGFLSKKAGEVGKKMKEKKQAEKPLIAVEKAEGKPAEAGAKKEEKPAAVGKKSLVSDKNEKEKKTRKTKSNSV